MSSKFLTAEWRKLAIANYSIDHSILFPYWPHKTELDLWNGKCYVSLVGFCFINTKLKGLRIPFHTSFEEVNLRFYVRYRNSNGWKRGVTFINEIVPKSELTFVANTLYKEKYMTLPMRHSRSVASESIFVSYHWKYQNNWNDFSMLARNSLHLIAGGKEKEFITDHYCGYTQIDKKRTSEYGVEHPRWQTYSVIKSHINVNFGKLYGQQFDFLEKQKPDSIMLAEGSEISVLSMNRIE